jgi:hypothetical protein
MSQIYDFSKALQRSIERSDTAGEMRVAVILFSDLTENCDANDVIWMFEQAKGIKPEADTIIDGEIEKIKAYLEV